MLNKFEKLGKVEIKNNRSIISCVGEGMKKKIGTASAIFSKLSNDNINIEIISQECNEMCISVVVKEKDTLKAINKMHELII